MKTTTALLGVLGLAMALAAGGCASAPQPCSLVYYDAGAAWGWRDGYGWNYLGERRIRVSHNQVLLPSHPPAPIQGHPPGAGKPPAGGQTCYFFIAADGSVLTSQDGIAFWPIGHLGPNEEFLPGGGSSGGAASFRGTFNSADSSFKIASSPTGGFHNLVISILGSAPGGNGGGNGYYRNSTSSYRGGSHSGSGGSYRSSGGGGGGGRSFSGSGGSGGGNRSGGGGGERSDRQR